jgi:hypothetical protein
MFEPFGLHTGSKCGQSDITTVNLAEHILVQHCRKAVFCAFARKKKIVY